jgi:hypothetical protein
VALKWASGNYPLTRSGGRPTRLEGWSWARTTSTKSSWNNAMTISAVKKPLLIPLALTFEDQERADPASSRVKSRLCDTAD